MPYTHEIDPWCIDAGCRARLRRGWGVGESTTLIAAVGDPASSVDAMLAITSVGLARETGRDAALLLDPRARGVRRAREVIRGIGRGEWQIVDDRARQPWEVLPGCDAGLVMSGGLHAGWVMAAGKPIVALDNASAREQLEGGKTALFAGDEKAGKIAWAICRLMDDRALSRRIGENARAVARLRYGGSDRMSGAAGPMAADRGVST